MNVIRIGIALNLSAFWSMSLSRNGDGSIELKISLNSVTWTSMSSLVSGISSPIVNPFSIP